MYMPAHFQMDKDAALTLVDANPFATLISLGADGLLSTPMPFLLDWSGDQLRLIGHVARANPHWKRFDASVPSLAIFQAGDAYISPSWYPGKATHHKVVPTWNYNTVHIHGKLEAVEDADGLLDIVTRLTSRHEAGRDDPWSVSDAPADYIATMLRAIVGLVLTIDRVEGKAKLSQNRSEEDRAGMRKGLQGALAIP